MSTGMVDAQGNKIAFGDLIDVTEFNSGFKFSGTVEERDDGKDGFRVRCDVGGRHGWFVWDNDGEPCYDATLNKTAKGSA